MQRQEKAKVALVTGGARRVGRAIALELAQSGFDLAITYLRSESDALSLTKHVEAMGQRGLAIKADLTRPQPSVLDIFDRIQQQWGRLDVLVNNASLYLPGGLPDVTSETLRRLMAIHVEAPLLLAQALAPMLRTARGHIVNMSDLLASRPWPRYMAYCASKAALSNLTLGLAKELAPEVTVNAIAPGVVEWPENYPQADRDKYLKRVPLARAGTPQEVANLVKFLVTNGSYITGQIIPLDGGRSIT